MTKTNAIPSWSGYNHQGKVGIYVALKKINELKQKGKKNLSNWVLVFENAEDFDIREKKQNDEYKIVSRHQVKAHTNGNNLNNYKDIRQKKDGYNLQNLDKDSKRFLHVIVKVGGWDLDEEKYKSKYPKPKWRPNNNKVELYEYTDGKKYCELATELQTDPIGKYIKEQIKTLLTDSEHVSKDNDEYHQELSLLIQEKLQNKISKCHTDGGTPILTFNELYELILNSSDVHDKNVKHLKSAFAILFDNYLKEYSKNSEPERISFASEIVNQILSMSIDDFKKFISNIHPHKEISKDMSIVDLLGSYNAQGIQEVFFDCLINKINNRFTLEDVSYHDDTYTEYTLSAINTTARGIYREKLIEGIANNDKVLWLWNKDYLVNEYVDMPTSDILNLSGVTETHDSTSNENKSNTEELLGRKTKLSDRLQQTNLKLISMSKLDEDD